MGLRIYRPKDSDYFHIGRYFPTFAGEIKANKLSNGGKLVIHFSRLSSRQFFGFEPMAYRGKSRIEAGKGADESPKSIHNFYSIKMVQ
jgi:hypothetical protein